VDELGAQVRFEENMPLDTAADLLNSGEVDILIAGQKNSSPDVLRAAIKINKANQKEGDAKRWLTSFFIMEKEGEKPLFFADCAVNESPAPEQLAIIAEQTCTSVSQLGYEPVVAFLSLSTFGSARSDKLKGVAAVVEATEIFKKKNPDTIAYGEIQLDAAVNREIFKKKAAKAGVELVDGKMPNVFIFPDGQSGNIGYKLLEQLGGYQAVGPMLDGTAKNIHDLSRGGTQQALFRSIQVAAKLYHARKAAATA
jgi:phosphate acetyltransferase